MFRPGGAEFCDTKSLTARKRRRGEGRSRRCTGFEDKNENSTERRALSYRRREVLMRQAVSSMLAWVHCGASAGFHPLGDEQSITRVCAANMEGELR